MFARDSADDFDCLLHADLEEGPAADLMAYAASDLAMEMPELLSSGGYYV